MAIENLIDSIKEVFKGRDSKKEEFENERLTILKDIDNLIGQRESLSYKALIEEDKEAIKEHEGIKVKLEIKQNELKALEEKVKALDKFELGADTRKKATDIYNEIQKEIDKKSKELGKKADIYTKARDEMKEVSLEIIKLYKDINLLPLELKEVIDLIEPESIRKTNEDIEKYKEILRSRNLDSYLYLFEDNRLKHGKDISREDINQILNGTIIINPYY